MMNRYNSFLLLCSSICSVYTASTNIVTLKDLQAREWQQPREIYEILLRTRYFLDKKRRNKFDREKSYRYLNSPTLQKLLSERKSSLLIIREGNWGNNKNDRKVKDAQKELRSIDQDIRKIKQSIDEEVEKSIPYIQQHGLTGKFKQGSEKLAEIASEIFKLEESSQK